MSRRFHIVPDVSLEGVEVAEVSAAEDRRAESQGRCVHRLVGVRRQQVGQGVHAQAGGEVRVEGRDRLAEKDAVVGAAGLGGDERAPSGLEVEPARAFGVERGGEAPRRAGGSVALPDVGDLHRLQCREGAGCSALS